jgi:putative heme-binding domain-containing protein
MEGGNAGFCSLDGKRPWAADKRPGQDVPTAEWRQEDPGIMPAGDVYGGGSPTGITYYENGALGARFPGLLLACEPGRNTIFGYFPKPEGAGYHLERFNFLTTNAAGKFAGSDFLGGAKSVDAELNTKFRPSDLVVGVDGALYVSDWFDPRVGGHSDLDDQTLGSIYRIAPKGFKSSVPKIDLTTAAGCVEALRSPGVNVRFTALQKLTALGKEALPVVAEAAKQEPDAYFKARFIWALTLLGTEGCQALENAINAKMPEEFRMLAFRALRRADHNAWEWTVKGSVDPSPQVRREAALALRDTSFEIASPLLVALFKGFDGVDRTYLNALGIACEGKESKAFFAMTKLTPESNPLTWSPAMAKLAWRLHPPELVNGLAQRAAAESLSFADRKEALVALGYTADKSAAMAMVELASKLAKGPLKDLAEWWLLNRKDNLWKDHGLAAVLKTTGLYDPEKIVLVPSPAPAAEPAKFTVEAVALLTGEPKHGALKAQACFACHRLGKDGVDYAPNLTGWAQRQTKEVLLRSIIDPSFDIAHGYEGRHITLQDGMILDGIAISDGDPVMLQSMGGLLQRIPRNRIQTSEGSQRSLMLSADQLGLSAQDVADVAAYLQSLH